MNQQEFLQQAHPMLEAVEETMARMFERKPTPEDLKIEAAEMRFDAERDNQLTGD